MQTPTIGSIVIYRDALGHDSPAIVTATQETLEADLVGNGNLRSLRSPEHLHLTVFTALTSYEHGALKAREVAPALEGVPPANSTWRWP